MYDHCWISYVDTYTNNLNFMKTKKFLACYVFLEMVIIRIRFTDWLPSAHMHSYISAYG